MALDWLPIPWFSIVSLCVLLGAAVILAVRGRLSDAAIIALLALVPAVFTGISLYLRSRRAA